MSKTMLGIGTVIVAAVAAIVGCTLLYASVVGLASFVTTSDGGDAPSLLQGASQFGMTFGLLSAAHWGLGSARRLVGDDSSAMLIVKVLTVALVALGIGMALTGGRWDAMFGGLTGTGVVLVVAWMALTHFVSKALERQAPTGTPAGAP